VTKLGDAIHKGPAAGKPPVTKLQAALAGKRPFKPVRIPGLELEAAMTVLGSERHLDIVGEVATAMEERGIPQNVLNQGKFELDEAVRTLAQAVVTSAQDPTPIGTASDWGQLAPEAIAELWVQYAELRAEHDPLVDALTEDEIREIRDAVSKKKRSGVAVLRCIEAGALSAYFGRPACELLDREVLAWGLIAGHLTLDRPAEPSPNGRRFKNVDAQPPLDDDLPADDDVE
jgi:hypothetical protein